MQLLPRKRQWRDWTLPSKLTLIGTYLTIFTFVLTITSLIGNYAYKKVTEHYWIDKVTLSNTTFKKYTGHNLDDAGLEIDVEYPQIKSIFNNDVFTRANNEIKNSLYSNLKPNLLELTRTYTVTLQSPRLLSIKIEGFSYYKGALNGDGSVGSINLDLMKNQFVDFYDVFDLRKNALYEVKQILLIELYKKCPGVFQESVNNSKYIPRFGLSGEYIIFIFSEYEVSAGACGYFEIKIPYTTLASLIRNDGPLSDKLLAIGNWDGREYKREAVGIYY